MSILLALEGFETSMMAPGPGKLPNEDPYKGRDHPTAASEPLKAPEEGTGPQFILKAN